MAQNMALVIVTHQLCCCCLARLLSAGGLLWRFLPSMTPLRACCLFIKPLAQGQNSTLQVKSQWRLAYRLQILALTKPVGHHKFMVPPGRREDLLFSNLMVWEVPMGHYNARFNAKSSELSLRTDSFKRKKPDSPTESDGNNPRNPKNSIISDGPKTGLMLLERAPSFKSLVVQEKVPNGIKHPALAALSLPSPFRYCLLRTDDELDAAAIKLQKFYKSSRTRRNLADCAVVIEELWWKALDFAALKKSSVSFFDGKKHETAVDRWTRARTKAAKVGKGLSKDGKAQKLALQHWLEAIDPRHRYGHNLHLYYDVWFRSESIQPFFYWLDVGDGKEVNLKKCPRSKLQRQCIKYLGPKEREAYEVIIESGKLVYKKNKELVETTEDSKWIFVLSTSRALYVGRKRKGEFQHSSFLSGGATTAAGRLVAHSGLLQAIWPYSGHYHPTEQNFKDFISFLEENQVDLTNVKRYSYNDTSLDNSETSPKKLPGSLTFMHGVSSATDDLDYAEADHRLEQADDQNEAQHSKMTQQLVRKWTTGAGPRIKCVCEYPVDLQSQALENVNLSPKQGLYTSRGPIPSPRCSPKHLLSPRFSCMGLRSP